MSDNDRVADALKLSALRLPEKPKVVDIRWEPYVDWMGEDSLQVYVILDESTERVDRAAQGLTAIVRSINDSLLDAGIDLFPYPRFLKPSELAEAGVQF